jgi:glutamate N-acetyltransferase/amino-acid N-acetyltransferase
MVGTVRIISGGVTAPQGFRAGSTYCGIKQGNNTRDLALLLSDRPCVAAGTFTTSRIPAAPVLVCKEHLKITSGIAQAVVVNSGNANCATGPQGMIDAMNMAATVAAYYNLDPHHILVGSTGIIGRNLPIDLIESGIPQITLSYDGGDNFAQGIITTDTHTKNIAVEFEIGNKVVRIGGTVKGSGMIYPNMATMLCYITTDAVVDSSWLQTILRASVADSLNMVSVDGDMSTNDTVLILANGLAGNDLLKSGSPGYDVFTNALNLVTRSLAIEIARDGEGASKLMEVTVRGAIAKSDARLAARSITLSPIWQCAVAGGDPNWGRIIAALGASGVRLSPESVDILLGDVQVVSQGIAASYSQEEAKAALAGKEVKITIDLHQGSERATAWGCDLTQGYIDENTNYTR